MFLIDFIKNKFKRKTNKEDENLISITIRDKTIKVTMEDMVKLDQLYKIHCTAEYLMENYNITDRTVAFEKARNVREIMDKYDYLYESDAIKEVLNGTP